LPGVEWHFLGALQTNKVKLVVGKAALIHTCDRISLAQEIRKGPFRPGRAAGSERGPRAAESRSASGRRGRAARPGPRAPAHPLRRVVCIPPASGDPRPHFVALRELARSSACAIFRWE